MPTTAHEGITAETTVAGPVLNEPVVTTHTALKGGTVIIGGAFAGLGNAAAVIITTAHVTKYA